MRGVFSTGVLDAFLAHRFNPFDLCIGVSAGATNAAAFLAGMHGRNYRVYTDYSLRPEFISFRRFLTGGHLMDLDWLWEITIREVRLDLDAILNAPTRYYIGLTRVADGKAVCARPRRENLEEMLKASSAMPVFYRGFVPLNGVGGDGNTGNDSGTDSAGTEFADGGLSDPIPVLEAHRRGAHNILVLRSRPHGYRMKPKRPNLFMRLALRDHPKLRACLAERPKRYNDALAFIRRPPEGVRVLELNPPDELESSRLTKDSKKLTRDYRRGIEIGERAIERWQSP